MTSLATTQAIILVLFAFPFVMVFHGMASLYASCIIELGGD